MTLKEGGLRGSLRNIGTGVPVIPDSVVDSFEDGDVSEWSSNNGSNFSAVQTTGSGATPPKGSWCAEADATGGTNQNWQRSIGTAISPTDVVTYIRVEGAIPLITYPWRDGGTPVFYAEFGNSGGNISVNGVDTGVAEQLDTWYEVIFRDIDWGVNTIGAVEIDGTQELTDVAFENNASSVDNILHFTEAPARTYSDYWAYTE